MAKKFIFLQIIFLLSPYTYADERFRFGTWNGTVRTSGTVLENRNQCTLFGESAAAIDVEAFFDALEGTNQSLYAAHLSNDFDNSSCPWREMEALLQEADERGLDFEVVGGLGLPEELADVHQAIGHLREIASDPAHSSLKSVVMNDFNKQLALPWHPYPNVDHRIRRFTRDDVGSMFFETKRATSLPPHPRLDFIPYMSASKIGTFIVPSYIMGIRGHINCEPNALGNPTCGCDPSEPDCGDSDDDIPDFVLRDSDRIGHSFTFPSPVFSPGQKVEISFLMENLYRAQATGRELHLVVEVNGVAVGSRLLDKETDCIRSPFIDRLEATIPFHVLRPLGEQNEVEIVFSIEGGTTIPRLPNKMVIFWDLQVNKTTLTGTTSSIIHSELSPIKIRDGFSTSEDIVFVGTNEDLRIDRRLDELWFKYTGRSEDIDIETYKRVVSHTNAHLSLLGKRTRTVFWGNHQWSDYHPHPTCDPLNIDLGLRGEMYRIATDHSNGIVNWRLENHLHNPEGGVFTHRKPLTPSMYDQIAFYPGQTPAIPGWFQSWDFDFTVPGDYTIDWNAYAGTADIDRPRMRVDAKAEERFAFIPTPEWGQEMTVEGESSGSNHVPMTFLDILRSRFLRVSMSTIDSFARPEYSFQFRVTDPDGNVLEPRPGSFRSAPDAKTRNLYDCTTHFYNTLTRDACE